MPLIGQLINLKNCLSLLSTTQRLAQMPNLQAFMQEALEPEATSVFRANAALNGITVQTALWLHSQLFAPPGDLQPSTVDVRLPAATGARSGLG